MSNGEFDSTLVGQRQQRLEKLQELRKLGINPFPAKSVKTHNNSQILDDFKNLNGQKVTLTGRLTTWREHGKVRFADLTDQSGQIQLYFKKDEFGQFSVSAQTLGWQELNLVDVGDFIQATGTVTKTQRGEISVLVNQLKILTKTIRPHPTKGEGLKDKEERFRRRYVDMVVNPHVRKLMERRAAFWQAHRMFFKSHGFHEVNTPVLEHIPGGGDAVPFVTHMNAIDEDFFLRISHELPLKRLVGAGFEKVYDIGARFRNEGLSDEHLPEHVAMEFYWAYADWQQGMQLVKEMFDFILRNVYGDKRKFRIRGFDVDFDQGWEILDFAEIMHAQYKIENIYQPDLDQLKKILVENKIDFDPKTINVPRAVDSLWKILRKNIAGPAFLINHPKYLSPLQKPSSNNPLIVERMQPIIAGSELGNGWSEVNDPLDQYERFVEQQKLREAGDDEAQWLDIDYVEMLEYGMPPTFGWGHSERLFWFLENVSAREGVPFPQLKFHISDSTKQIYPEIDFSKIRSATHKQDYKNKSVQPGYSKMANNRTEVYAFLKKHVQDEYQLHHAEMVETAMIAIAQYLGLEHDAVLRFGFTGLIHDWDFYKWPKEHPGRFEVLRQEFEFVDDNVINAIKGHADIDYPRQTKLAQALMACDEFSGLMYAYKQMVGSYGQMKISSIRKKVHKDTKFAAKINREDIKTGIDELGIDENKFFELVRDAFSNKYDDN